MRFQRSAIKKNQTHRQLLRLFWDFLCFGSWGRKGGSGHRKGEGHKVSDCSKTILSMQLGCKRPLHGAQHSPTSGRVLPFPWQCTEGHILRPYASVPFIAGCFCLLQGQWQPLELTPLPFVQVSVQRGGWCPPPAVVTGMKYWKVNASYTPWTGEVHGTALIFSLFRRVVAWLFNPSLTAWIIRKGDINAFNVYTRAECWLLTRSKQNNEMP